MRQLQFFDKNTSLKLTKQEFDSLIRFPQALLSLRINLVFLGVAWVLFGLFFRFLPPQLPLLFSKPWGEDQLVTKPYLVILPGVMTVLFIINTRLASLIIGKDKLLAIMILWAQTICSFLATVTLIKLILLLA